METPAFQQHALLPKARHQIESGERALWPQLPADELLRQIADHADLLGRGRGVAYLLVSLPDPLARQLEAVGAETADDEDTNDAEPEEQDDDRDLAVDWSTDHRTGVVFIDDGELQPDDYRG